MTSSLSSSLSTSRLTKTSTKMSCQVPTPMTQPLREVQPKVTPPVSEKTNQSSDELTKLKKMMAQLLVSVTAINQRVHSVEGGSEKRLSPINNGDKAPKTPSKRSNETNATSSWKLWNQQMVGVTPQAPPSRRLESFLQPSQETRWAVVNINNLSMFKAITFLNKMEEATSQGGWPNNKLVRRTANQLEGEAEAICRWVRTGLKARVSLKWTALQEWLVQAYGHKKLDCYYTYNQLTQIQQVKSEFSSLARRMEMSGSVWTIESSTRR